MPKQLQKNIGKLNKRIGVIFNNTKWIMNQSTCRSSKGNIEQNCGTITLT